MNKIYIYCFLLIMFCSAAGVCAAGNAEGSRDYWTVLTGYGQSWPGWGLTKERVKTVDVILRYTHVFDKDIGRSWYKGNHEMAIELPVSGIVDPSMPPIFGVSFLFKWMFTSLDTIYPYVIAGGGPVYTDAEIPGYGSNLSGSYQVGMGLHIPLNDRLALNSEARYHHISNMGNQGS